jgi:hypothetical protein
MTGIKTVEQMEEYKEILNNIVDYIQQQMRKSIYNTCFIDSHIIKYNLNNSTIRYSVKLENEIIDILKNTFIITINTIKGNNLKTINQYTFIRA